MLQKNLKNQTFKKKVAILKMLFYFFWRKKIVKSGETRLNFEKNSFYKTF
jgi:hypothetical protein